MKVIFRPHVAKLFVRDLDALAERAHVHSDARHPGFAVAGVRPRFPLA
jgi:hypothetical protein